MLLHLRLLDWHLRSPSPRGLLGYTVPMDRGTERFVESVSLVGLFRRCKIGVCTGRGNLRLPLGLRVQPPTIGVYVRILVVLLVGAFCAPSLGIASPGKPEGSTPCQIESAPVQLPFKKIAPNVGVAPRGFVDLGSGVPVVHGVVVSKWQDDVDLFQVAACGGSFAYIRVSAGTNLFNEIAFSSLWGQARAAKLWVGPYHHLTASPSVLQADSAEAVREVFTLHGRAQASLFLKNVEGILRDGIKDRKSFGRVLAPVLDVGESVPTTIGRRHGAAVTSHALVCAWIDSVESSALFRGRRVVLFTQPSVFSSMDLESAPCIKDDERIIWLELPTRGASSIASDLRNPRNVELRALCTPSSNRNRCLLHQYTNRGGKALGSIGEGLSLSRFEGTNDEFLGVMERGTR